MGKRSAGSKAQAPADVVAAGAAAFSQVAAASAQARGGDPEYIFLDPNAKVERESKYGSATWVLSRGRFELLMEATILALEAYRLRKNVDAKHIDYIRACVQRGTKKVLLIPADKGETGAKKCSFTKSGIRINLASLLVASKLDILSGQKELFPVTLDPDTGLGPALVVDMTEYIQRKPKSSKKSADAPSNS